MAYVPYAPSEPIFFHQELRVKKLSLDLETLSIESFGTAAVAEPKGTVAAHEAAITYPSPYQTCAYHCTYQGPTCFNQC